MRFTNKLGFPQAIADAVKNDPYSPGDSDITVTQLLSPPQQVALRKHCAGEIVEDVSDRIYALMGQAMHVVLERANITGIAEKRVYTDVDGWIIGGAFDSIALIETPSHEEGRSEWILQDYKQMSIYEIIYGLRPEKEQQLNLLDWLLSQNTRPDRTYPPISRLEIVGIFRDWSKPEAARRKAQGDKTYPQHQVGIFPVNKWSADKQFAFVKERLNLHRTADEIRNSGKISKLPECSDEERWASETTFALMKTGRKSALKVESDQNALIKWAIGKGHAEKVEGEDAKFTKDFYIDIRPGENRRCQNYCDVSQFCNQWARINPNKEDSV
jgi:hypothetical protein